LPRAAPPAPPPGHSAGLPARSKLVIRARRGWRGIDMGELWRYRELLWFLALRDVQLRYKQTAFGVAWAVLQPLVNTAVFSLFLGYLLDVGRQVEGGVAYPAFTLCALLPWQLFASSLNQASVSVVANRALITKVYFPRVLVPLAALLCCLFDFAVASTLLVPLLAWYGIAPAWTALALPLFLLLAVVAALSVSLWLSALNALYHDVQYTLGFLVQVWLFATPVVYPSSVVPERWRWLLGLNPMASVVDGFRWCLLGSPSPDAQMLLASVAVVAVSLV